MRVKEVILTVVSLALLTTVARVGAGVTTTSAAEVAPQPSLTAPAPPASPFPDIPIPGVPNNNPCCLWQVEKRVDGERSAAFGPAYGCDTGSTSQGSMSIKMTIQSAGLPCDQQDIIPDGSTLVAKGDVIERQDLFGHYNGQFVIVNPANQVLFEGYIETMDRVGSHHLFFNCEKCNPQSHFEGWLVGRGSDLLPNHTIRALLVARGTLPTPASAAACARWSCPARSSSSTPAPTSAARRRSKRAPTTSTRVSSRT